MAIFKYAKALVLAPAIGSALIGIAGLAFGVLLIIGREAPRSRMPAQEASPTAPLSQHLPAPEISRQAQAANSQSVPLEKRTAGSPPRPAQAHLDFRNSIASSDLAFLQDYQGRPVDDVAGRQKIKALAGMVAPYAPFHLGVDLPLPQALDSVMLAVPEPVEIYQGRYAMIAGRRCPSGCRGRGFLWVDLKERIALGGILFYPSNGEPSPSLTIFSRQVDRRSVRIDQLPAAFVEDLGRWAEAAGITPVTTRYFIGASGDRTVLMHDENYCTPDGNAAWISLKAGCESMNAQAALIDNAAVRFVEQTRYASNATMRMISFPSK